MTFSATAASELWEDFDPTVCPVCGRDSCEDHLPPPCTHHSNEIVGVGPGRTPHPASRRSAAAARLWLAPHSHV